MFNEKFINFIMLWRIFSFLFLINKRLIVVQHNREQIVEETKMNIAWWTPIFGEGEIFFFSSLSSSVVCFLRWLTSYILLRVSLLVCINEDFRICDFSFQNWSSAVTDLYSNCCSWFFPFIDKNKSFKMNEAELGEALEITNL